MSQRLNTFTRDMTFTRDHHHQNIMVTISTLYRSEKKLVFSSIHHRFYYNNIDLGPRLDNNSTSGRPSLNLDHFDYLPYNSNIEPVTSFYFLLGERPFVCLQQPRPRPHNHQQLNVIACTFRRTTTTTLGHSRQPLLFVWYRQPPME
jgi:hypothetical protein